MENSGKQMETRAEEDFLDWRKPIPSKIGIDGNVGVEISFDWKSRERERSVQRRMLVTCRGFFLRRSGKI